MKLRKNTVPAPGMPTLPAVSLVPLPTAGIVSTGPNVARNFHTGDASLLQEITTRVGQADRILQGSADELRNAAKVILAIGPPETVFSLICI